VSVYMEKFDGEKNLVFVHGAYLLLEEAVV
jgi:hypothetical protein